MIFSFPWYLAIIPAAVSGLLLLIAFLLWGRVRALAVLVGIFGALIGSVFGPMLFLDRVSVDEQRVVQRTGFWFAPTVKGFALENVDLVRITTGRDLKNRPIELWIAESTNGEIIEIDPGDLWEQNGAVIVRYLREQGIPVVRQP